MSIELISRIIGLIVFGSVGTFFGHNLGIMLQRSLSIEPLPIIVYRIGSAVIFAILGFIITPWITVKPIKSLRKNLSNLSAQTLIFGIIGLVVGLVLTLLLAYPMSLLGPPFGNILPVISARSYAPFSGSAAAAGPAMVGLLTPPVPSIAAVSWSIRARSSMDGFTTSPAQVFCPVNCLYRVLCSMNYNMSAILPTTCAGSAVDGEWKSYPNCKKTPTFP